MTEDMITNETAIDEAAATEDITVDTPTDSKDESGSTDTVDTQDCDSEEPAVDYEALIKEDVAALKAHFPELSGINDVTDLDDPLRYAALRDLGLTPKEAYLATSKRRYGDTRSHLRRASGRNASGASSLMSAGELAAAREIFPGKSDADIQRLYKRVRG